MSLSTSEMEKGAFVASVNPKLGLPVSPSPELLARTRTDAGYSWGVAKSAAASPVGMRPVINPEDGRITEVNLVGRPAGKHRGKQGQHTTAFAATQESVVSATVGRTEAEAKAGLCLLFKALQSFPAYRVGSGQPPPPEGVLAELADLAKPDSAMVAGLSLADMTKRYIELREAMPGTSLDTGAGGSAPGASPINTHGHAEADTLTSLRDWEEKALKNKADTSKTTDQKLGTYAANVVAYFMKMYDVSSESAGGLLEPDIAAQRETFLRTVCQAFPALFVLVGATLTKEVLKLGRVTPFPDGMIAANLTDDLVRDVATPLAAGNTTGKRPPCAAFSTELIDGRIEFTGRPPGSLKGDNGQMGDHTCAMQLMKDSASGLFLTVDGEPKSAEDLLAAIEKIKTQFGTAPVSYFDPDDSDLTADSGMLARYKLRFQAIQGHLAKLDTVKARIKTGAPVPTDVVLDLATAYLELVDDRPTAVHFGTPAGGHDEAGARQDLDRLELQLTEGRLPATKPRGRVSADRLREMRQEDFIKQVLGLFDSHATMKMVSDIDEDPDLGKDGEDCGEKYLNGATGELMFFLEQAYPAIFQYLLSAPRPAIDGRMETETFVLAEAQRAALQDEIKAMIQKKSEASTKRVSEQQGGSKTRKKKLDDEDDEYED